MATYAEIDFKNWAIHLPSAALRGSRLCPIVDENAITPCFKLTSVPTLSTPFGATSWDGGTRLTLDYYLEEQHLKFFNALDQHFIAYLAANSERLLKKSYTIEEIRENYRPLVNTREGYAPTIRTKVNTIGARRCRVWTENCQSLDELPADLKDFKLCPVIAAKGMWALGKEVGITLETAHLQVGSSSVRSQCPFNTSAFKS